MSPMRIALPSTLPGGLEASIGAHFGHCDIYTLVDLEEGRITGVATLPPVPHEQGGCLAAVQHLAQQGVTALVAGGMGLRPLQGFTQAGIQVFRGTGMATVGSAVEALVQGTLESFSPENTCRGGHHAEGHTH